MARRRRIAGRRSKGRTTTPDPALAPELIYVVIPIYLPAALKDAGDEEAMRCGGDADLARRAHRKRQNLEEALH